jgi:hypothetical protein
MKKALRLRARFGYAVDHAVCPVDIAQRLGVDVWFRPIPSLEGMYSADRGAIIINALRPAGRRRYTTGHELGHHLHGHGTSFDAEGDLVADTDEEFIANNFARALLMPKLAVVSAFTRRGWSPRTATAVQAFVVAQDLGVGFTSLLDHMSLTQRLLDRATAQQFAKVRLAKIRAHFLADEVQHDLVPIDEHWGTRPADLEVGDVVVTTAGARFEGSCMEQRKGGLHATTAGEGELIVPGRVESIRVRVSPRHFAGLARFRHLEEADD